MRATIEDVAAAAGVSTATVSRALRGLPQVSPATRQRILRAAAELGYAASKSASSLASGRTHTVGVVTPYVARWFFATILETLERELHANDYDVLLFAVPPGRNADQDLEIASALRQRVDAVVVLTVPVTGHELDALRRLHLPLAFVGAAVSGAMCIRIDDVDVGRKATQYLLDLGHRRIAHIGGDPGEPLNFSAPVDRRAGWASALRAAGIEPDAALDVAGDFTVDGGRAAMATLMMLDEPPTAVFAASDEMAIGALVEARKMGTDAARGVSVIGVDNHPMAEVFELSTIEQPVCEQARVAATLLLGALRGDSSRRHEHVLLPTRLVARGSTHPTRSVKVGRS